MRTAIVYDRVNKWGGAERVLLALHEIFPDAPLYTSVYSPQKAPWAKVFPRVIPSFLQKLPVLHNHHELLGWLTPITYESFNFDGYDLVISVTSEAAKGIITKPQTKHICYCLTPTRYLWSGYEQYLKDPPSTLARIPFYKTISLPFLKYTKYWDKIAAQRPDVMIAISTVVKTRIKKYYDRDSETIFPPVETDKFDIQDHKFEKKLNKFLPITDYYLIVSRLEPYKKVDLAIRTFNELGLSLVVIGIGSEALKLKEMAGETIIFKDFVGDDELPAYYQNAKGFIFPQEEDFGIAAVEAQSSGCPVIAYSKGGALDTIVDGKTGLYFNSQDIENMTNAIKLFDKMKFDKNILRKNAERFAKERFKKEFLDIINKTV